MWFELQQGSTRRFRLRDEQSIWPAPDGIHSSLVIITETDLIEEVVLATPRVCRLRYEIDKLRATMILSEEPPAPWPEASRIEGRRFELMVTDRGPLVVPAEGSKLPNRLASWLSGVSENMRSCWPVPPDNSTTGTQWESTPAVPGGLPPNTRSAKIKIVYRVASIEDSTASIEIKFGMNVVIKPPRAAQTHKAEGRGALTVRLERQGGFASASRTGVMEIIRPSAVRSQLVRSKMQVVRA